MHISFIEKKLLFLKNIFPNDSPNNVWTKTLYFPLYPNEITSGKPIPFKLYK